MVVMKATYSLKCWAYILEWSENNTMRFSRRHRNEQHRRLFRQKLCCYAALSVAASCHTFFLLPHFEWQNMRHHAMNGYTCFYHFPKMPACQLCVQRKKHAGDRHEWRPSFFHITPLESITEPWISSTAYMSSTHHTYIAEYICHIT